MALSSLDSEVEKKLAAPFPSIVRLALRFKDEGNPTPLPTRIRAPLRRMAPEQWSRHLAELYPVLIGAKISVDRMTAEETARWASLVHLVAVLSGTGGRMAHAASRPLGSALLDAGYSEARLMKLLGARGAALPMQVARLARFLAAKGVVPVDLRPLADLILFADRDVARAEAARLAIARNYFTADTRTGDAT